MTIHGHILCWNEIEILPFVIDYWKRAGVDKLYVYDNGSTDGCLEEFKKYDWIEVIPFESEGGKTDEFLLTKIRNTGWKLSKGKADWVIVSDFDEVPYCTGDIREVLKRYEDDLDASVFKTKMPICVTETFPEHTDKLLHEMEGVRFGYEPQMEKTLLFNPNRIDEMNWSLGCHSCSPYGTGQYYIFPPEITFYHLKHLGKDYAVRKSMRLYENLREDIKRGGVIDSHYKKLAENYDKEIEKILK